MTGFVGSKFQGTWVEFNEQMDVFPWEEVDDYNYVHRSKWVNWDFCGGILCTPFSYFHFINTVRNVCKKIGTKKRCDLLLIN